jgi:diaminopimelate epimerase
MTPRAIPFTKMQATGNAFVLVDAMALAGQHGPAERLDWPQLAVETADPHFAVGHDGLLVVEASDAADFRQRMFNPDGTEDMCGNGLLCTAKHLHDTRRVRGRLMTIETIAGVSRVEVLQVKGARARVRAELGRPVVRPLRLDPTPALGRLLPAGQRGPLLRPTYVSFGTPHVVVQADHNLPAGVWEQISAEMEHHPQLGERVTATWFTRDAAGGLSARFWERSVGETLACGTGAASAAAVALAQKPADGQVTVSMPGGRVMVSRDEGGSFHVTGDAVTVFRGTWRVRGRPRGV